MLDKSIYLRFAFFATVLALVVVALGAYVRLSDAGLGCPDWPGCYGKLAVPESSEAVRAANQAFPERPLDEAKAWKEMLHRYLAGLLGLLVLLLAVLAWRRRHVPGQPLWLPGLLLSLVIFQALLGMWTVTLLLKPTVVMAHLLGGMATLGLLWWLCLRQGRLFSAHGSIIGVESARALRGWALLGLAVVVVQLALGGWTSANYAALACPDFPLCLGRWWPDADFANAFVVWQPSGVSYEGGVLSDQARTAIHLLHRLGAVVTFLYIGGLSLLIMGRHGYRELRIAGGAMLVFLLVQVGLGIGNILMFRPLTLAVAHNTVAALLLLSVVTVCHMLYPTRVSV